MFGSLGLALETPRCVLEARLVEDGERGAAPDGDLSLMIEETRERLGLKQQVAARWMEAIPRHQGFGSGTQHRLAAAFAVSRLAGLSLSAAELGRLVRRGRRSGVGLAVFEHGGFVVDAGRLVGAGTQKATGVDLPPMIFRHAVPEDWLFLIVVPPEGGGMSGAREEEIFRALPPMGEAVAGRISRLTLMKVMPSLLTDDIQEFGRGIEEIQCLVGEYFAPYQGGVWATAMGKEVAARAHDCGAYAVGQSSWGPAVYALVRGEEAAMRLIDELRRLPGVAQSHIFFTRANNVGMTWRKHP